MLFHLVYGEDKYAMMEFIFASAQRLYSLTENAILSRTILCMTQQVEAISLQQVRVMFFLLLNVDMVLKEYVCDTQNHALLAAALNITDVSQVTTKQSYAMTGARQADATKLESFFLKMSREIIPLWLQNQGLGINDLVTTLREEYLVA